MSAVCFSLSRRETGLVSRSVTSTNRPSQQSVSQRGFFFFGFFSDVRQSEYVPHNLSTDQTLQRWEDESLVSQVLVNNNSNNNDFRIVRDRQKYFEGLFETTVLGVCLFVLGGFGCVFFFFIFSFF